MTKKQGEGAKAQEIRQDAKGQFAKKQHGGNASGVASADVAGLGRRIVRHRL